MTKIKSDFIKTITERGYLHQCTDLTDLDHKASQGMLTAYVGYDATADSLHIGNLVSIMMLHWLQNTGHKPIVLMGGGTTKVGDPSGRDETRKLLNDAQISNNIKNIQQTCSQFLKFGEKDNLAITVNNQDWLDTLEYIPFLREVGQHFTINRMLSFDSVKLRLEREQPLTFLEFNYMILQAFDFLELSKRFNCNLQMGGSDQWGNIINGIELARRIENVTLFGLTTPLITTSSGTKMGKTASGAIWLNPEKYSAYDYWQFWRNTEDDDVERFLKLFTTLPLKEITKLSKLAGSEINEAKKILATEATSLLHGHLAAETAASTSAKTFELNETSENLPTIQIPKSELEETVPAFRLLTKSGLTKSNSEARRLIIGGGCRINDITIEDEMTKIGLNEVDDKGFIKISAGKKRHVLIQPI